MALSCLHIIILHFAQFCFLTLFTNFSMSAEVFNLIFCLFKLELGQQNMHSRATILALLQMTVWLKTQLEYCAVVEICLHCSFSSNLVVISFHAQCLCTFVVFDTVPNLRELQEFIAS